MEFHKFYDGYVRPIFIGAMGIAMMAPSTSFCTPLNASQRTSIYRDIDEDSECLDSDVENDTLYLLLNREDVSIHQYSDDIYEPERTLAIFDDFVSSPMELEFDFVEEENESQNESQVISFEYVSDGEIAQTYSFYDRVRRLSDDFNLNKSQLAAILNVERKSIYNWKNNPQQGVRAVTIRRVDILERFRDSMDAGHQKFLSKMAFGALGHKELAKSLLQSELAIEQLVTLYDQYWVEFDGMLSSDRIREKTKDFHRVDGYGVLV